MEPISINLLLMYLRLHFKFPLSTVISCYMVTYN